MTDPQVTAATPPPNIGDKASSLTLALPPERYTTLGLHHGQHVHDTSLTEPEHVVDQVRYVRQRRLGRHLLRHLGAGGVRCPARLGRGAAVTELPDVRPGQVWADNDPRSAGRTLRVIDVVSQRVICEVVTNIDNAPADKRGNRTRIALRRFVPTSTGYRLVQDVPDVPDVPA